MRRRAQLSSWLVIGLLPFIAAVATANEKEADDGLDIYFRDASLMALSDQAQESYPDSEAGESKRIERAFPDAPPQIPHTLVDMLPITLDDNECVECHHPDNVASQSDLPLPKSHFMRAVMGSGGKGDSMVWVVQGYEDTKEIVGNRYNCTMCHTAQATNVDTPSTKFITLKRKLKE
ncbi:MAG: nitrate reductase cytochrome c-type subunit [Deltaproteobacteria bacterium]|nr:nitrate reductase cytochrome c-type subunit [Deltaproteobacteria bacterium]MBW2400239.1 nitrate reductase cytochrome c-type subunit [Deltaproteobacteria bacterium]MBW2666746.1 nitrate reductase cytochrome c-type subunit [Deltaproteobacteria bacterium]